MDNRSTFLYHFYGDKEGTQKDRLSVPTGHGAFPILGNAGAGKSTPDVKRKMGRSCDESQGDLVESKLSRKSSLSLK